jgi:peptidoglycan/LPS O-acetylase OafA/YrhL
VGEYRGIVVSEVSVAAERPAEHPVDSVSPDAAGVARSEYRPHLDGLRAVAVYLVVAFHSGITTLKGGFIGVDIFFVLSGYLVTQLLVRDLHGLGRIRLSNFYARRFRRLLPAAMVALVVTAAVFAAIAAPSEFASALSGIRAACVYVANWFFIRQSNNYFAPAIQSSPVIHFWSLAIEEQFYLIWPLLLFVIYRATTRLRDRQWPAIRLTLCALIAASLIAALIVSTSDLNRAYYGTDTRAYQMLTGALLAISADLIGSRAWWVRLSKLFAGLSFAALLVLATDVVSVGPIQRGLAVVVATGVLLLSLDHGENGIVRRGLSVPTATFLGRISYGTYLWHWLVIVVAVRVFDPSPWVLFVLSAALATSIASLSYQVLERPVRVSTLLDRHRRAVIAGGLAVSVLCAFVLIPPILDTSRNGAVAATSNPGAGSGSVRPSSLDWKSVKVVQHRPPDCIRRPPDECIVVHGSGPTVALVGDSHAAMLLPSLTDVAKQEHWTLAALITDGCPWQDGLYRFSGKLSRVCKNHKADWRDRVIRALNPRIMLLVEAPLDRPGVKGLSLFGANGELPMGSPQAQRAIDRATDETVARYRRDGRDVVIFEPIPQWPQDDDPLACISHATTIEQCRFVAGTAPSAIELNYRRLAHADKHVWSIDIDRLACPYLPICDQVINGTIVWADVSHLSGQYARTLAAPMRQVFEQNRIGTG